MSVIDAAPLPFWPLLAAALGFLVVWGVGLLLSRPDASIPPGKLAIFAFLTTLIGYAATGFALHFGGIGILIDHPDAAALVWEWTPLRHGDLALWGMTGWAGFGMADAQTPLAALLFLTALPMAATASLLTLHSLWRRLSPAAGVFFATLTALFFAPVIGNWTQAGGWLMHLGESIGAGDGFLDFSGASFFLLAGGAALAVLLAFRNGSEKDEPDPYQSSAAIGAGLLTVGGVGWIIASPLHLWGGSSPVQSVLNGLLALAAGGLIGLAYAWATSGEAEIGWTARSAVAGWVASLAALPWMSPLQAMLLGATAAWIFILAAWLINELLAWRDDGDILTAFGLPAAWGLIATGFFAPAPGQLRAQIIGVVSIALLGFFTASVFLAAIWIFRKVPRSGSQKAREAEHSAGAESSDAPATS